MILSTIIAGVTCLTMILSVLFFPKLKFKKFQVDSYWIIVLLGALLLLITKQADIEEVGKQLVANTAINPVKILILFISMTILSVFLDELGFFGYLANYTLKKAKTSQVKMFMYLYITVSVLTVFTSNDVIILSFTPFICYFAKNAKISPLPYLAGEFVAANTWSMALIIGNPTNIYLATAFGIDFLSYLKVMLVPTLIAGTVAFIALMLLFGRKLKEPISGEAEEVEIKDKTLLTVGLIHLGVCTVTLAIGSYIGVEMWLVSLVAVISLFITTLIVSAIRKSKPIELVASLKRAPWQLIPFVLSMFIMILALNEKGVTVIINKFFGEELALYKYGVASFLSANLINNIPMSVLFSAVLEPLEGLVANEAVFATIIGSNLGALLTPIGALAGIMWGNIISKHDVKFGYVDFLKLGVTVALPTLAAALLSLNLMMII